MQAGLDTKILDAHNDAHIHEAVRLLQNNYLVALPTETVYGLAAKASSLEAIAKICAAKNRPAQNPLIYHVHNQSAAKRLFAYNNFSKLIKRRFCLLADAFWPGPLTIVAPKSTEVLHINLSTVAVRVPKSAVTLRILGLLDQALVMPSANISTRPSATSSAHVLKTLDHRIDAVVDAGACHVGIESSVVRIDSEQVCLLRPGIITRVELENILQEQIILSHEAELSPAPLSPGMLYKHYSPHVESVHIINSHELKKFWPSDATLIGRQMDIHAAIKTFGQRTAVTIIMPNEAALYAHKLYEAFYQAEERSKQKLIIIKPPQEDKWAAIYDRLQRAAEKS
jgi:L-threonylcarbamoyladenylate synthase